MKIDFSLDQLRILDEAIQQLPYRVAAPLIAHINAELQAQQKIIDTPIELDEVCPKTHQQNGR